MAEWIVKMKLIDIRKLWLRQHNTVISSNRERAAFCVCRIFLRMYTYLFSTLSYGFFPLVGEPTKIHHKKCHRTNKQCEIFHNSKEENVYVNWYLTCFTSNNRSMSSLKHFGQHILYASFATVIHAHTHIKDTKLRTKLWLYFSTYSCHIYLVLSFSFIVAFALYSTVTNV